MNSCRLSPPGARDGNINDKDHESNSFTICFPSSSSNSSLRPPQGRENRGRGTFFTFFLLPQILPAVWELPKRTCCLWCSCSLQRGRDFHSNPSLSEFDDPNYNCSIINIITIAIVTVNVDITGIVIIL